MVEKLLVERAKRGDKWAFKILYERYVSQVWSWLWKKTGSREEGEDLTSEVWLAVVEGLKEFDGRSSFKNWLFGIAKHKLMDFYRRKYGRESLPLFEELVGQKDVDWKENDKERKGKVEKVEKILSQLTERERMILEWRFLRGYSVKETARKLEMSEGAVKTAQSRALRKARQLSGEKV